MAAARFGGTVNLAPQQVLSLLECVICMDYYDDPWMCSDGFVYCRDCAGRWIGDGDEWISPRTNLRFSSVDAFLSRDVMRACAALECKHAAAADILRALLAGGDPLQGLWDLTLLRHKGAVAALPETIRGVLDEVLRPSLSGGRGLDAICWDTAPSPALYAALELAAQAGRLPELLARGGFLRRLMILDRHSMRAPLVVPRVWHELLKVSLREPCQDPPLTELLWQHYVWRRMHRDAVHFTAEAVELRGLQRDLEGVYARSAAPVLQHDFVLFECRRSGARFYASQAPSACPTSEVESQLQLGGARAYFTSQSRSYVPTDATFWMLRRGFDRLPVFPDAGSELVEEDPEPGLSEALPRALSVLEKQISFLPHHVLYLPIVEDNPPGGGGGDSDIEELGERVATMLRQARLSSAPSASSAASPLTEAEAQQSSLRRARRCRRKRSAAEAQAWAS